MVRDGIAGDAAAMMERYRHIADHCPALRDSCEEQSAVLAAPVDDSMYGKIHQCRHEFVDDGEYDNRHRWQRCSLCQGTRVHKEKG